MATTTDRVAELQRQQQAAYAEAEAAAAAERAEYPDAQFGMPPLRMPVAEYDPTPAEQQAFADTYRAEHADADRLDHQGGTPLSEAVYEWRQDTATQRWTAYADAFVAAPPCDVCGASSDHDHVDIGGRALFCCRRCRPSVHVAMADAVAGEKLANGQTRAATAKRLVVSLLTKG